MTASVAARKFGRQEFADKLLNLNGGAWPDMEGLIRDLYVARLGKGRHALDVGVNHGVHLVQMAQAVGPQGHVIGFEAVPELARRTLSVIDTHYPDVADTVTLHKVAVSDTVGTATFYFSKMNDSGLSGLADRAALHEGEVEEITVPVRLIDDYMDEDFLSRLDFAKVDIEGAEYHAFKGATQMLKRRPLMAFEWDTSAPSYFGYAPKDLFDLITSYGYEIYDLFGFHYPSVEEWVTTRVWNFVAVPPGMSPGQAIEPSIVTLRASFPALFTG